MITIQKTLIQILSYSVYWSIKKGESRYSEMAMASPLNGEASVSVTSEDSQVYLVVASVPDFFGSYQHYPYRVRILEGGECIYEQKLNTMYISVMLGPL